MDDLSKKVRKGLKWNLINQVVSQLIFVWFGIYLARLLGPEAYGLIGMITVFSGFANLFIDFGFSSAIIYDQKVNDEQISTVFWINLFIGIVVYGLFFIAAPAIADFYNEPRLVILTRVVSINLVLHSLAGIPNTLLSKNIDFKRKVVGAWIASIVSYGIAFTMAYLGYGVWSLIAQTLTLATVNLIVLWGITGWRPKLYFSVKDISPLLRYGSGIAGTSILGYITRNLDNLFVGKFLGNGALGIYTRSYTLMMLPIANITNVFNKVLFPAFSLLQNDIKRMADHYLKVSKIIALLSFPMMFTLFSVTEEFVFVFLGSKWLEAIPIIKPLCVLGAFQSILALNGTLYNATGNATKAFKVTLIFNFVLIPAWLIGLWWGGLHGMVIAYVCLGTIGTLPILHIAIRQVGLSLQELLNNLKYVIIGAFLIVVANEIVSYFISLPIPSLMIKLFVSLVTYSFFIYIMERKEFATYLKMFRGST